MPQFRYKGRDLRGAAIEGRMEAASADAVADLLMNSSITPIDIREAHGDDRNVFAALNRRLQEQPPDLGELILLSRQLHTLTRAGVPLTRALRGLIESSRNAVLARALQQVLDDLEAGRELAVALARHEAIFTPLYVSLVRVGEQSGRLDDAFAQIARYLEQEKDTRERIKSALRYPTIVLIALAVAIGVINVLVIPAFAGIFERGGTDLPLATRALLATSNFFVVAWPYLIAAGVAGYLAVRQYVRTEAGRYRWDRLKLRLPLIGPIILRATLARFARTFAMTQRSGVPLIQGLTVVARAVDNAFVEERILQMRNGIERGESLSRTATATAMFTPLVLQMIAVGEETGAVDEMMDEVGAAYEREVDYDLKSLAANIEPVLLLAVGALVLILALGVFMPMWDMATAVRR
ncbi:type II secretion system F family protein [Ectothiorhodospiraceae bacterium 2226]|nr:type II secretion system F family protein [Ectothiorhodospiraceae bacterium 2226]